MAKAGSRRVPRPNPEKSVSPEATIAAKQIKMYSISMILMWKSGLQILADMREHMPENILVLLDRLGSCDSYSTGIVKFF
jgi:hypothetical protein